MQKTLAKGNSAAVENFLNFHVVIKVILYSLDSVGSRKVNRQNIGKAAFWRNAIKLELKNKLTRNIA